MKCKVSWIDPNTGQPTPDDNEAICLAVIYTRDNEKPVRREEFPCCSQHRDVLRALKPWRALDYYPRFYFLGNYTSEWMEEPLSSGNDIGSSG